jgi:hypothetical protein
MKCSHLARFVSATALCLIASASLALAQETVEYSALGDNIRDPNGSLAAPGEAVLLGTFAPGFNFSANQTFSSLSGAFTQFDSTTIGAAGSGTSSGQFFKDALLTNTAFNGNQLYVWVLNSSTPASATAWVILTNNSSTWKVPTTAGDFTAIDMSDVGTFIPSGAFGIGQTSSINNPAGNQTDWKMTAAIPEPSTFALMIAGGVGFLALRSRGRR